MKHHSIIFDPSGHRWKLDITIEAGQFTRAEAYSTIRDQQHKLITTKWPIFLQWPFIGQEWNRAISWGSIYVKS